MPGQSSGVEDMCGKSSEKGDRSSFRVLCSSFRIFVLFCFFFLLILQPYMCHTHTHAGREDTGGMVTYIIVKSICKASPCRRHCAPCSSTPCPTNLIPLTARGACGNLFGLSNAHFLLRVLALCVCVCVCVCWCVCISSLCA